MPALDTITTSLLTRRIGIPDDHAVGETDNWPAAGTPRP